MESAKFHENDFNGSGVNKFVFDYFHRTHFPPLFKNPENSERTEVIPSTIRKRECHQYRFRSLQMKILILRYPTHVWTLLYRLFMWGNTHKGILGVEKREIEIFTSKFEFCFPSAPRILKLVRTRAFVADFVPLFLIYFFFRLSTCLEWISVTSCLPSHILLWIERPLGKLMLFLGYICEVLCIFFSLFYHFFQSSFVFDISNFLIQK